LACSQLRQLWHHPRKLGVEGVKRLCRGLRVEQFLLVPLTLQFACLARQVVEVSQSDGCGFGQEFLRGGVRPIELDQLSEDVRDVLVGDPRSREITIELFERFGTVGHRGRVGLHRAETR